MSVDGLTLGSSSKQSRRRKSPLVRRAFSRRHCASRRYRSLSEVLNYFGGAGVKISRLLGSGFGLGFGAFLGSFLPLSLLPMDQSMTQTGTIRKEKIRSPATGGA